MRNQKGFTIIEGLLILAVVAILGFTGWFVWHSRQEANKTNNQAAADSSPPNAPNSVKQVKFSTLPSDLHKSIVDFTAQKAPACVKNNMLLDSTGKQSNPTVAYDASGAAIVPIGCDSPEATLFVRKDGGWQEVAATQSGFECAILQQYKISPQLVALSGSQKCWAGQSEQTYTLSSTTPKSNVKYLTIKEWGVQAPYSGSDTLTAKVNGNVASIVSANLASKYGCTSLGAGQINRLTPTEGIGPDPTSGIPAQQAYTKYSNTFGHVGNYYFEFFDDNSSCGNGPVNTSALATAQINANAFTKTLVTKLRAY